MEQNGISATMTLKLDQWLNELGVEGMGVYYLRLLLMIAALFLLAAALRFVVKRFFLKIIQKVAGLSAEDMKDFLMDQKLVDKVVLLIPVMAFYVIESELMLHLSFAGVMGKVADIYLTVVVSIIIQAFIGGLFAWLKRKPVYADKPLNSYRQLFALLNYSVATILALSLLINKSPLYLLSALGALTAVIILVFRDSLLGLTASIQISTNDIVRIGDWITIDSYGADGYVTDINLTTILVRNFDNTFSTVPTYAFISNSFKNWRGMEESGGRRIKRAILIDQTSIRFAGDELIARLQKLDLLDEFIRIRLSEIEEHNRLFVRNAGLPANGRHLTNVGLFRVYMQAYVSSRKHINNHLTCMVRQLEPRPDGLPIEIYAFSKEKTWPNYENVMSDIFDHMYAVIPLFDLCIFQHPSGNVFKHLDLDA